MEITGDSNTYNGLEIDGVGIAGSDEIGATFYFCGTCGSTVYWLSDVVPGAYGISVGSFVDPDFPPPTSEVWTELRHRCLPSTRLVAVFMTNCTLGGAAEQQVTSESGRACAYEMPADGHEWDVVQMVEKEAKFDLELGTELPAPTMLVKGLGRCSVEEIRQNADYYDTVDLRLTRAGASLRFRSDDGWTVKLPKQEDGLLERDEFVFGLEDLGSPPAEAA